VSSAANAVPNKEESKAVNAISRRGRENFIITGPIIKVMNR
jgi:hypothetical protein